MKRSIARYFSGSGPDKIPFDGAYASTLVKGETQVFVKDFIGHRVTAPSLLEFEIVSVLTPAYADGQGDLVIPPLSEINYGTAIGVDLGTITGAFEIHGNAEFTALVTSGSLAPTTITSVAVGFVGPFYVRYRLESSKGVFSTWFTDVGSPFLDFPILDVAAVLGTPQSTVLGEAQDTIHPLNGKYNGTIRAEFGLASAGAAGVLYEAGGRVLGLAFYIWNNAIYANAGNGGSVGDLSDRYEISAPISVGVHEAIFTASKASGAQLYLDGVLVASSPAKAGVGNLSGGDPAGTGRFYGAMSANYALFASYGNGSSDDISVIKAEVWTSHYPGP